MSLSISFHSSVHFDSLSFLNVFPISMIQRIKEIAENIFSKCTEFSSSFNVLPSNEGNLKTFALVSCLSLIALLVISTFSKQDSHLTLQRIRTRREQTRTPRIWYTSI